jgi:hypothetical protein
MYICKLNEEYYFCFIRFRNQKLINHQTLNFYALLA